MRRSIIVLAFLLLPVSALGAERPAAVDPARDHIRGRLNARISLIEYGDYQCPFCRKHHPVMLRLSRQYRNDVNWVFRHFPLPFHPLARTAAHAAECAAEQKGNAGFWRFTDTIIRAQNFNAADYAAAHGMDSEAFTTCISDESFRRRVQEDVEDAMNAGVSGTPTTFFWDHETDTVYSIEGAYPISAFRKVIDGILKGESPEQ